jgi:hypothetical protein
MPFDIIGEHAEQDMSTDAIRQAVMDGPHMQIDGLDQGRSRTPQLIPG